MELRSLCKVSQGRMRTKEEQDSGPETVRNRAPW